MATEKTGASSENLQIHASQELQLLRHVYDGISTNALSGLRTEPFPDDLNYFRFKFDLTGIGSIEVELSGKPKTLDESAPAGFDPLLSTSAEAYLAGATLQVRIAFQANGEGTLTYAGSSIPCLGKPGQAYLRDQIVENVEGVQYQGDYGSAFKFKRWISKEFVDPQGNPAVMPWSVKIDGTKGIFVHEGPDTIDTNGGPSQGCIHLAAPNAEAFYNWITARTRITISYPW